MSGPAAIGAGAGSAAVAAGCITKRAGSSPALLCAIEGTWRVVSLEVNGEKAKDEDARKHTVANGADGTWSLRADGKEVIKGTSTLDPTKKPKK